MGMDRSDPRGWAESEVTPKPYAAGTWGPSAAIALTERDGRQLARLMALHPALARVTDRIIERSRPTRRRYLDLMAEQKERGINRSRLSCGNFAHGFAASQEDKEAIKRHAGPNVGIVTAYNDMLSAHQPYGRYPEQIKISPARPEPPRRSPAASRRCATASPRASRAWTCPCSAATSSLCRRRWR